MARQIATVTELIQLTPTEKRVRLADKEVVTWLAENNATVIINDSNPYFSCRNHRDHLPGDKSVIATPKQWTRADGWIFYFMTFRFMTHITEERAIHYYDTYIRYSLKRIARAHQTESKVVTDFREPEIGKTTRAPVHVHAIVGIPPIQSVVTRFERTIKKRCGKHVNVDFSRIKNISQLETVYGYVRKWKTWRMMS